MAISLVKGQRLDIGLKKLGVGLGWDPAQTGVDFDLDASAFMLTDQGEIPEEQFFVFYGNQQSPDAAVASSGDDRTGGNSDGDDETLTVDIDKLDSRITDILVTVSIHEAVQRRQNFGQVRNSFIRIYDADTQEEICRYDLDEDFSVETAVEFGRLYKRGNAWRFEALGRSVTGGLDALVSKYAGKFT